MFCRVFRPNIKELYRQENENDIIDIDYGGSDRHVMLV